MYFVLGMLSIIAVAFVAVVVWGIVKINKLTSEMVSTHKWIDNTVLDGHAQVNQIYKQIEDVRLDKALETERIYREIADFHTRTIAECHSYTDSRIDKALGTTGAKQLIKG